MNKPLRKILLVDDDEDILMIAKYSLRDLKDVSVKFVSSGEEAIKEALQYQPDLILLDIMMPKMDGISTLNAIRLLPTIANTPVAFLTAKAQKAEIDKYFTLGIVDVIVKPFDPLTLADKVKQIWEKCTEK